MQNLNNAFVSQNQPRSCDQFKSCEHFKNNSGKYTIEVLIKFERDAHKRVESLFSQRVIQNKYEKFDAGHCQDLSRLCAKSGCIRCPASNFSYLFWITRCEKRLSTRLCASRSNLMRTSMVYLPELFLKCSQDLN
jgi:hypothetical protein